MERLTHADSKGWYIDDQSVAYDEKRRGKEIDLLAAYEDTGLTPKEVLELASEVDIWKSGYQDLVKISEKGISQINEAIEKLCSISQARK